jgi:hypothetical protein
VSSTERSGSAESSVQSSDAAESSAQSSVQPSDTATSTAELSDGAASSAQSSNTDEFSAQATILFEHVDSDLKKVNEGLHKEELFLGNPDLLENVEWVEFGRQRVLVSKKNVTDDGDPETAVLQWVGEISPHNFWLYPCAGWNGERGPRGEWEKASPFENAKARANIRAPSQPFFATDWALCLRNLENVMNSAKKPNARTALSVIQDDEVKVRHSIFQVRFDISLYSIISKP